MADNTAIEWTDATWNPVTGCTKVSPGCAHCYAERLTLRFGGKPFLPGKAEIVLHPERLELPLRWRRPRRIFVTSMSDAHHDNVPDAYRDKILAVIALTPQHTYQWLTKRAEAMRAYFSDPETPFRVQRAMDALAVDARHDEAEEWRAVVGYEGHYEVSSCGRVRSKTGRPVQPRPRGEGYRAVSLSKNGEVRDRLVQHLVLEAFVGPASSDEEARHANGDRSDNRTENLSWGTHEQNMADAARHGTAGAWMKARATLTIEQVAEVRRRRASGEKLDDIAAAVGSNRKQISAVARGAIYKPAALPWPLPNVWLGVSVENQRWADERIPLLLDTPAAVRFVSCEPLLGPIDLTAVPCCDWGVDHTTRMLDWVIVGGESGGPQARRLVERLWTDGAWLPHRDKIVWVRSLRDQCAAAGVPFLFKQWGGPRPKSGGRLLDGRTWDEYPLSALRTGSRSHERKGACVS